MKNRVCIFLVMLSWIFGFSQDIPSDKKYNFELLLEESHQFTPVFEMDSFKNEEHLLFFPLESTIVFPIVEEKQPMNFSAGTRQNGFKPKISFGDFHQKKVQFKLDFSYRQQQPGAHRILKGYDYCLRPIY